MNRTILDLTIDEMIEIHPMLKGGLAKVIYKQLPATLVNMYNLSSDLQGVAIGLILSEKGRLAILKNIKEKFGGGFCINDLSIECFAGHADEAHDLASLCNSVMRRVDEIKRLEGTCDE